MWSSSVITWDGKMVPCCFDKDANYVYGDLKESQFSEIWNGKNHILFRKKILSSRKSVDICRNCTEGSNIWAN
jgi:radical SAM protein with 4Fe4S-binding SPASM domain